MAAPMAALDRVNPNGERYLFIECFDDQLWFDRHTLLGWLRYRLWSYFRDRLHAYNDERGAVWLTLFADEQDDLHSGSVDRGDSRRAGADR